MFTDEICVHCEVEYYGLTGAYYATFLSPGRVDPPLHPGVLHQDPGDSQNTHNIF